MISTSLLKKDEQPRFSCSTYDDSRGSVKSESWQGNSTEKEGYTSNYRRSKSQALKKIQSCAVLAQKTRTNERGGLQVLEKQGSYGKKSLRGGLPVWAGGGNRMGILRQEDWFCDAVNNSSLELCACRGRYAVVGREGGECDNVRPANHINSDKSVEELQVEVELQRLNNHTPEEDQTDQEDGDNEDAEDQEIDQPPDLTDYQLVRDREPRTRMKPLRFRDEMESCYERRDGFSKEEQDLGVLEVIQQGKEAVRHTSIRVILALTACKDYELEQLDVKTAFLHGNLKEVIYMKQPPGYEQGAICKCGWEFNVLDGVHEARHHWEAVKWILKYLRGTANVSLVYGTDRKNHVDVTGFVDSDYAKDPDKDRMPHMMALLTTEAGCMTFIKAWKKEAIWLRGLLEKLGVELNRVAVNCDNQGAIHLSRNHVFHEWNKHINVRYHFIREVLEAKAVKVLKVGTEHNAADALTKVVPGHKLQHYLELLSVGIG
ncbi:retrovirus-related pol polyprotein from transposon TNT 1-94 [Tanacetum coccineum]